MIRLFDKQARLSAKLARVSLVVSDLDGTLLNDNNEITPATLDAIAELREHGVDFLLASGRSMAFTEHYARIAGTDMPAIAVNGGLVSAFLDGEPAYVHTMPEGLFALIATVQEELETPFEMTVFTPEGLYATSENAVLPKYLRIEGEGCTYTPDLKEYESRTGLAVVYASYLHIQQLSVRIAQKFGRSIGRIQYSSKMRPDLCYLELSNANANKGTALAYICRKLNISKRQVAAIGDFANDIEMLRFAGVSGVMANAMDEIAAGADYVTERDNNEGGVAEFLEQILNEKRK